MGRATVGRCLVRLVTADTYASESPSRHAKLAAFSAGAPGLIRNVATQMFVLDDGEFAFPVSVNDGGARASGDLANSYVVSPLTAYTGYADYEIDQLGSAWLSWPLRALTRVMGKWLIASRIDCVAQVNNWLLSTNVYPSNWLGEGLEEMTAQLVEAFPDHAIGWRSLNYFSNKGLIERLLALGYLAIPSRQVYLFDARVEATKEFQHRHNTRLDARMLRKTRYQFVSACDLEDSDFERLEHLYNLLYLQKYCPLNPQFTAEWMRRGHREGWLEIIALRTPEGRIDGVIGWFGSPQILTAPVVGYDTKLPQRIGLYRLITQLCLQEAIRRKCLLNFSSGAAHFKRLRGGHPEIEYSLVYVAHLSPKRRRVWRVLAAVLQGIGVPLMRKLKL